MRYLAYGYALFFIGWSAFEFHDLRRSRYPRWLLGVEVVSKILMFAGMALYFIQRGVAEELRSFWSVGVFPIVGVEVMLRVFAIRHEEQDLEFSAAGNRRIQHFALVATGFVLGPAAYMNLRFAYPEIPWSACAVLIVAVAIGFGLAFCWPRLSGCFKSISERNMVNWLEANKQFGRSPDEIELLDNSLQKWPGFEEEKPCQLFRVRYGQDWYIGLTGPATHCLATPMSKDIPLSEIYELYRDWFADHAFRLIIREAAKDCPEDFRELVEDALKENTLPKGNSGSNEV